MIEKVLVSFDEAVEIILANTPTLAPERVAISKSLNRVLAEDVEARREHPPWNNSAMDGYAVRWQDICNATPTTPVKLKVVAEIQAGSMPSKAVLAGEAIQIMTGAPTPEGADTVVCIEDTHQEGDAIFINHPCKQGSNVRLQGEDIKQGDIVLDTGKEIRPTDIGIMATAAYSSILVYQKPKVSVLATGNELIEPGEQPSPEKIINSNSYSISALVHDSHADCVTFASAKDTREDLEEKIIQALHADVALIIGGVSMGKYDYVKEVLEALGCKFKFWRVAVKPGHPVAFGIIKQPNQKAKLLFGLPGNPVSCVVAYYQFVRPALRKMIGHQTLFLQEIDAIMAQKFSKKPGRVHLARATTHFHNGQYHVQLASHQGSGILSSFSQANSLAILPAEQEDFPAGESIKVQLLP